jgi:hypothetical protein
VVDARKSLYSAFETLDIYTTFAYTHEASRNPPCPTCCTSREATVDIGQHFVLVVPRPDLARPGGNALQLLMSFQSPNFTHLGQVDVRDDDLVQRTGSILAGLAGVAVWVVLVGSVAAGLPGLGALSLSDLVLAAGGSRVGAEVPAGKTESAGHDREEDLWSAV